MAENPPKLRARFVLDESGVPEYFDDGSLKHYKIRLFVEGAPPTAESVLYRLDASFYNPTREVIGDPDANFEELITSYGDFELSASLPGCKAAPPSLTLSSALRLAYEEEPDGEVIAIRSALDEIENM